jgi:hypothetical protein
MLLRDVGSARVYAATAAGKETARLGPSDDGDPKFQKVRELVESEESPLLCARARRGDTNTSTGHKAACGRHSLRHMCARISQPTTDSFQGQRS